MYESWDLFHYINIYFKASFVCCNCFCFLSGGKEKNQLLYLKSWTAAGSSFPSVSVPCETLASFTEYICLGKKSFQVREGPLRAHEEVEWQIPWNGTRGVREGLSLGLSWDLFLSLSPLQRWPWPGDSEPGVEGMEGAAGLHGCCKTCHLPDSPLLTPRHQLDLREMSQLLSKTLGCHRLTNCTFNFHRRNVGDRMDWRPWASVLCIILLVTITVYVCF